jgi:hypothetical protein
VHRNPGARAPGSRRWHGYKSVTRALHPHPPSNVPAVVNLYTGSVPGKGDSFTSGNAAAPGKGMRSFLSKYSLALLLGFGLATGITQAQSASQDAHQAGRDLTNAAKNAGKATAKTSKRAARGIKKGVKSTANKGAKETEKGADKVRQKTQ